MLRNNFDVRKNHQLRELSNLIGDSSTKILALDYHLLYFYSNNPYPLKLIHTPALVRKTTKKRLIPLQNIGYYSNDYINKAFSNDYDYILCSTRICIEGRPNIENKKIKNLLSDLNKLTFYSDKAPKSLGIEWVYEKINPLIDKYSHHPTEDLLNTFTHHIVEQIINEIGDTDKVLFSGGGVYNEFLMNTIKSDSKSEIVIPSSQIIEFKEALIFAFLGVLRYLNIDNCYSSVTGASKNHCSGKIFLTKV